MGRTAEKEPQITRKLPQLVGKWVRLACVQWRDATKGVPNAVKRGQNAGTEGQNAIWRGQNASLCFSLSTTLFCAFQYLLGRTAIFRDEQPICSTVLGRTTASWDQRRFWASASNDRQPAEKAPQITRKLPQLVGPWLQSAFDERRDATSAMPKAVNRGRNAGTEGRNTIWQGRNAFNGRRNAKKFRRNAFAKWRDATKGMPNAVNGERNTGTEGRNTIWRGQNASLCFSLSTTLFCAFQYLLGRTAIFRDEQPICSTVLGRTTAGWDQRRFWASASNDKRLAEKAPQITGKLAQLVGKWVRPAFGEKRDAANAMPKAVNRGRNAGTEGQNAIWRGRNAIFRDEQPICSTVLGQTTVSRDKFSFCTFFLKRYPKLLAAKFLCKLLQLLSLCYPKFWRPVISCRADIPSTPFRSIYRKGVNLRLGRLAEKAPQITKKLPQLVGKWLRPAFGEKRDAANVMPKAVNRGRNALAQWRYAITERPNASCGGRNAFPQWRNATTERPNASVNRRPAEKAPQHARKLPQLVGNGMQSAFIAARNATKATRNAEKLSRTAFIEKCNVATYIPTTGNERRIARKLWSNAKKFRRNALAQWRDANIGMPKAVNRGRNTIWRARNTEIRDEQPICSTVLRRTTANRDELSFCTFFSSFFSFLRHSSFSPKARGYRKRYPKLLAANLLSKVVQLLSFCYPTIPVYRNSFISIENKHNDKNFWRPVISCRADVPSRPFCNVFRKGINLRLGRLAEKAPQITKKLPQLVGNWLQPAFVEKRDAKKIWRNVKKFGRNASALTRGAIPSRDRFFGLLCKRASRTLKPYTIYLTALNVLFCVCLAHARQSSSPEAAHGVALSTDSIKPLKIGDSIPEALWNLPLQMVKAGKEGSTTVKLSDYRDKLIILDFWATWCAPCVAAFPKMDSLKRTFADNLALISVTTQEKKMVADFLGEMLEQTSLKGTSIVNDRILSSYFPYRLLPHYVWIDRGGILRAMTGLDVLNAHQIDKLLSSNKAPTYVKEDVGRSYDYDIELKDQVSQQALLKNSTFAAYTKGFSRRNSIDKKNAKITLLNMSIAWFYRIAFSEFRPELLNPNRFIIEVKDSLKVTSGGAKGEALEKWSVDNAYCYELKMQPADTAKLFEQMRADIAAFFPYDVKIEQREMACLVLGKKSDRISLETKGGQPILKHDAYSFRIQNLLWKNFTSLLDMYYLQNAGMPFVDETGITGKVDLQIKTRMTDYRELTKVLAKRGLLLKKEIRRVPVIVLRDREGGSHE